MFSHGGATAGFSAINVFIPADTTAVVILSNTVQGGAGDILDRIGFVCTRVVDPPPIY